MLCKGTYFYAKVEGDEIIYKGKSLSPASLANKIVNGSRNARRDLWLKRPENREWSLADESRAENEVLPTEETILAGFDKS